MTKILSYSIYDGIGVVTVDTPNSKVNTLSLENADEFKEVLNVLINDDNVKGGVLISGKPDCFFAGANIKMLEACKNAKEIQDLSRMCKETFNLIAECKKPIVVAIMGQCLGAGLEAALACHYRIAVKDKKTVLAVPEVMIGLLPGAGGTQRLLKLLSLPDALDMMLTGKNIRPDKAKAIGLVNKLIEPKVDSSPEETRKLLENTAIETVKGLIDGSVKALPRRKGWIETFTDYLIWFNIGRYLFMKQARNRVMNLTFGHYPAPLRILDVVEETLKNGTESGNELETRYFGELGVTKEAKALIGLFHGQTHCKKNHYENFQNLKNIGVLGANSIGACIAEVTMVKGFDLLMIDNSKDNVKKGMELIKKNVNARVLRKQFDNKEKEKMLKNFITSTEIAQFENVDFVIESISENFDVKTKSILEIESVVKEDCIIAVNTSYQPIGKIAELAKRPTKIIGMHYFTPVPKTQLLEIVTHKNVSEETIATAVNLGLKQGKVVIVVEDSPCFYVTRILTVIVDELFTILREGLRPKQLEGITKEIGWPVGLCSVVDEFGIDNIYEAAKLFVGRFEERFSKENLNLLENFLKKKFLGKKCNYGLLEYDPTGKLSVDNEGAIQIIDEFKITPKASPINESVQWRIVSRAINEAVLCLEEGVLKSHMDGDIGAVFGLGFPPFLGGPFRYLDIYGAEQLLNRMENFQKSYGNSFKACKLIKDLVKDPSKTFYK